MYNKHLVGITYNVDSLLGLLYAVAKEQENYTIGYLTNGVLDYDLTLNALDEDELPTVYPATVSIYTKYAGNVEIVVEDYITSLDFVATLMR